MVDTLINFMLGPFEVIGDFYFDYQIIFNTLVVGFALYKIGFSKKSKSQHHAEEHSTRI